MEHNTLKTTIKKFMQDKKISRRLVSIVCLLAMIVAAIVPWGLRMTGVAMAGEACCGITAHTHTEECGVIQTLVCGYEEGQLICQKDEHVHTEECFGEDGELICGLEEHTHSGECYHIHDDECYVTEYGCGLEEHQHDIMCYSDVNADVETSSVWERSLPHTLNNDWAEDLVSVAKSQEGYKESERNFVLDEDGITERGYSRYGAWYGNSYGEWNAMFVSFCLHYAGITKEAIPYASGVYAWTTSLSKIDLLKKDESYEAKTGDIIFFDSDEDGTADRAGIITDISKDGKLSITEGDWENKVATNKIDNDEKTIFGFVSIAEAYERALELGIVELPEEEPLEDTEIAEELPEEETAEDTELPEEETEPEEVIENVEMTLVAEPSEGIEITATGELPENAELVVTPLTAEQEEFIAENVEIISETEKTFAYDIKVMADGEEVTSEDGIKIAITGTGISEDNQVNAYDLADIDIENLEDNDFEELEVTEMDEVEIEDGELSFTTEGSTVVFFTVDFYYGEFGYNLDGLTSIKLSILMEELGIERSVTDISEVEFSDPKLLEITELEDDWCIESLKAFDTEELLTLTFINGDVIDIWVYDAQEDALLAAFGASNSATQVTTNTTLNKKADGTAVSAPNGQIVVQGGTNKPKNTTQDGDVAVSKTINKTDTENVFDIDLEVLTGIDLKNIEKYQPIDVVLVIDVSNSMYTNKLPGTETLQSEAALAAAKTFIDKFQKASAGLDGDRRIGIVTFNTNASKVSGLTSCKTASQATTLKDKLATKMSNVINGTYSSTNHAGSTSDVYKKYGGSCERFTNIEAGLKMANNMIGDGENKYIILLSDGFPTTYCTTNDTSDTNYTGWDPYMNSSNHSGHTSNWANHKGQDGYFFNLKYNSDGSATTANSDGSYPNGSMVCTDGTSYSDKGAARAQNMAAAIKNRGIEVFSIGVNIGGQFLKSSSSTEAGGYKRNSYVVDCYKRGKNYVISNDGSCSSADKFKQWLGNKIGSGYDNYYYDSTNPTGLTNAFTNIFNSIQETVKTGVQASWVAADPIKSLNVTNDYIEFVKFTGTNSAGATVGNTTIKKSSDTIAALTSSDTVSWDLKKATPTHPGSDQNKFLYTLSYRVRLKNEDAGFESGFDYDTNGTTGLQYKIIDTSTSTLSESKQINFTIPQVEGYLSNLIFTKRANSSEGDPIAGVTFKLSHYCSACNTPCDGNGGYLTDIATKTVTSGTDGKVTFTAIPSGHTYLLEETVPTGYAAVTNKYKVKVAYGTVTVTPLDTSENLDWDATVINYTSFELPHTGGLGFAPYLILGLLVAAAPVIIGLNSRRKKATEK